MSGKLSAPRRRAVISGLFAAVSTCLPARAQISATWVAEVGTWAVPSNWNLNAVPNNNVPPGTTYNAVLDRTMTDQPALALIDRSAVTINNLAIATDDQVQIFEGTLNLTGTAGSGSINNQGSVVVMANATDAGISINSASVALTGGGSVFLSGLKTPVFSGTGSATLVNINNTIDGAGMLGANKLAIINAGTIVASGAPLIIDPAPGVGMVSVGALRAVAGGQLIFSGAGGGAFDCSAASVNVQFTSGLTFTNNALINLADVTLDGAWAIQGATASAGRVDGTGSILQSAGDTTVARFRVNSFRLQSGNFSIRAFERANTCVVAGGTFSIAANSRLDLGDAGLAIDYSGPSPISSVQALILSGRNGGAWDGPGITSSLAAANATAIGYCDTAALGPTTFRGVAVDGTAVLVRYTVVGDINCDGTVNIGDFSLLAQNFNAASARWYHGDVNYDGRVNISDFSLVASHFNQFVSNENRAVPEPAAWGLILLVPAARRKRAAPVGST